MYNLFPAVLRSKFDGKNSGLRLVKSETIPIFTVPSNPRQQRIYEYFTALCTARASHLKIDARTQLFDIGLTALDLDIIIGYMAVDLEPFYTLQLSTTDRLSEVVLKTERAILARHAALDQLIQTYCS